MKSLYSLTVVLLLSIFADAQTETVVDPAGATVVEVISQNAAGIANTRILQTLVGSSTSLTLATSTALTTSSALTQTATLALTTTTSQIGPVAQPATEPATPGGPTPYVYTTTDAQGNTVTLQGIFTPTGPQTVLPTPTTTGTILGYSQWLSMIGTYTAPASAARMSVPLATGWYYFAATAFAGLLGGAWLIIL
ncbi:hypothetical protein J3R82DRAFT_11571, partial [Butyriboletus roseoflavus]